MPFIPSKFYLVGGRNKGGGGGRGEGGNGGSGVYLIEPREYSLLIEPNKNFGHNFEHNTVFLVVTLKSIMLMIYLILL